MHGGDVLFRFMERDADGGDEERLGAGAAKEVGFGGCAFEECLSDSDDWDGFCEAVPEMHAETRALVCAEGDVAVDDYGGDRGAYFRDEFFEAREFSEIETAGLVGGDLIQVDDVVAGFAGGGPGGEKDCGGRGGVGGVVDVNGEKGRREIRQHFRDDAHSI